MRGPYSFGDFSLLRELTSHEDKSQKIKIKLVLTLKISYKLMFVKVNINLLTAHLPTFFKAIFSSLIILSFNILLNS